VFAAAAAAGRILGLTDDQMHHALGIAGYSATVPTMRKFGSSSRPPMTKYDHLGQMAQAGVHAALLARRGFTGDLEVLEGDVGFWRFAGAQGCDWDFLTRDLGSHWTIPEVSYKWFPANHSVANPTIALLQRTMREHGLRPEEIEHVEVRRGRAQERPPREIRNQMDAWTVPAYTIAAGVYDVWPRCSWQEPAVYRRPDLLAFMKKIELRPLRDGDVTSTGNYWEHWAPIRVAIRARGQLFEGAQDHMPAMDDERLVAKFRDNVSGFLDPDLAKRLEERCWDLESLPSARSLAESLGTVAANTSGGD
jgi:2-methylcitrate dehydratase PrpD